MNTDDGEDDDFVEDEAEDGLHSTVLIVSTKDSFTLKQDVCMCCGSFGKGREGYLIGCVQCGQCFHPYCVNVKVGISLSVSNLICPLEIFSLFGISSFNLFSL